jgi:hypothetical protein
MWVAFQFLQEMRTYAMQPQALHSLRKITIVGIAGFFATLGYFITPLLTKLNVGVDAVRYLLLLLMETVLWISVHTLIFYFLSLPVPKEQSMHAVPSNPESGSKSGSQEHMEMEHLTHSVHWNSVELHSSKGHTRSTHAR